MFFLFHFPRSVSLSPTLTGGWINKHSFFIFFFFYGCHSNVCLSIAEHPLPPPPGPFNKSEFHYPLEQMSELFITTTRSLPPYIPTTTRTILMIPGKCLFMAKRPTCHHYSCFWRVFYCHHRQLCGLVVESWSAALVVPEGYQRIILLLLVKPSSVKTNLIPEQQQKRRGRITRQ